MRGVVFCCCLLLFTWCVQVVLNGVVHASICVPVGKKMSAVLLCFAVRYVPIIHTYIQRVHYCMPESIGRPR